MNISPTSFPSWKDFKLHYAEKCDFFYSTSPLIGFGQIRYNDKIFQWVDLRDGAIYSNKTARKIMLFFLESAITRPFEIACRFAYHTCVPISVPYEIYYALKKEDLRRREFPWLQPRSKLLLAGVATVRSIKDILRVPFLGTLLTAGAIAAVYFYYKSDPQDRLQHMMEWRALLMGLERDMVWRDAKKCYNKELQLEDCLHRLPRFCKPSEDPDFNEVGYYLEGLNAMNIKAKREYAAVQSLSPLSLFLWKIPNFFSHSTV